MRARYIAADNICNISKTPMEGKQSRLHDSHVAPLNEFVQRWRTKLPADHHIPWFDPCDGGIEARILFILEKPGPGPQRGGVDFVSQDNKDPTAQRIKGGLEKLGVDRSQVAFWNAVPAWNGKIRIVAAELDQGALQVQEVLQLMPSVRSLVLAGEKAKDVFSRMTLAGFQLPTHVKVFFSPHPAARGFKKSEAIDRLADAWKNAVDRARYAAEDEGISRKEAAESDARVTTLHAELANAGAIAETELLQAIESLRRLLPDARFLEGDFGVMRARAESLDTPDLVNVARALCLLDSMASRGSVATVIGYFAALEGRDYPDLYPLALWMRSVNSNPYVPFGTFKYGDQRLDDLSRRYMLRRTREANARLMADLRQKVGELALEESINQRLTELMREADEKAAVANQLRDMRDQISELSGRCDRLAQEAARQERHIDSLEFREFLQRGESLTAAGRLELILGQDRWMPSAFPAHWAEISNVDLAGLPESHRQALATRISRVRRGPWRLLYNRLAGA